MSDLTIHDRDTLAFTVPVMREGSRRALNLTGASVTALAGLAEGAGGSIAGTASVTVPLAGEISVQFPAAALGPGAWTVQVIVTLGSETQTVAALVVNVLRSLPDPS